MGGMRDRNEVRLVGWVGTVDLPQAPSAPLKFTLATAHRWKDRTSGDVHTDTSWHRVTVFAPPDGLLQRLVKGARVWVEGRLKYSKYERNGTQLQGTEIVAPSRRVELLSQPSPPSPQPEDQTWQATPAQDG